MLLAKQKADVVAARLAAPDFQQAAKAAGLDVLHTEPSRAKRCSERRRVGD